MVLHRPSPSESAGAQAAARLGILETSSPDPARLKLWAAFRERLRELGYIEGQNIGFDYRWANGKPDLLPGLAIELVQSQVDIIVTTGTPAAFAAQRATSTIPIVMATGVSVGTGLNQGAAASGANLTGLSDLAPGLSEKRMALLREFVPGAGRLAVLWDKTNPSGELAVPEYQDAARAAGIELTVQGAAGSTDFDKALDTMATDGVAGFIATPSAMFFAARELLAALALEHRLPAMYVRSEYAQAGGLMAYGAPIRGNYLRAAVFVDRILKGAKPAALSVEQPLEFELVINRNTARSLGLAIPESLLRRANQLIE